MMTHEHLIHLVLVSMYDQLSDVPGPSDLHDHRSRMH